MRGVVIFFPSLVTMKVYSMVSSRTLLTGMLLAGVLTSCARAPMANVPRPSSQKTAPPVENVRESVTPVESLESSTRTVSVERDRRQAPLLQPEDVPLAEYQDGTQVVRVRVVRRAGKYPLIRREEVVERGADGQPVVTVREMVADHLLVSLAPGQGAEAIAQAIGGEVRRVMPGGRLALIAFPYQAHTDYGLYRGRLAAQPGVAVAEPDFIVRSIGTPNDSGFANLWGMNNTGQTGGTPDADIDAPEAWNLSTGSKAVLVGVIDTGIDRNHVDLAANMWSNPGETGLDALGNPKATNGIDDDGNGYIDDWRGWDFVNEDNDPTDDHYHGTHCAGTIGGVGGNGQGVAGVCWNVSMVGLKFLSSTGSGAISDAVEAQLYANSIGCDLTSNSWGGGGYSQAMKDAIDAASVQGRLFVAAAGNSTSNNDTVVNYPSNYNSPNVIAVAATTHLDGLASFSNYGATTVHLGAPGDTVYSCQPGNLYQNLSGTSMATPHVAGACALLKSANPLLTGPQIKAVLLAQVDPVSALAGKTVTGGRLNIHRALLSVSGPVLVQDALVVTEAGNGDGLVNPGEAADLAISLANQGSQATTGVSAVLTSADPYVTIPQATVTYGDLLPGQTQGGSTSYRVAIAPGCPTPRTITLTLTATGGVGGPWTIPVAITCVTSAQLQGQVRRLGTGSPIPGATVAWTGATVGTRTTDNLGQFAATVPAGTYQVTATATGLKSGTPTTVSLPGAGSLILTLGTPSMAVSPTAVTLTAAMPSASVQIANAGDAALAWQATIAGSATMSGLWHPTSYRTASGTGSSWYYGIDATRTFNTGTANSGGLVFQGVTVPVAQPTLTFASWRQTEGGSTYDRSDVQVSTDGGLTWVALMAATPTSGSPRDGVEIQAQTVGPTAWTGLFQEIDNTATWHPVSVNLAAYAGQTVAIRFWFDTVDSVANAYEGWYVDDIVLGSTPLTAWMTVSATQGTVNPAASGTFTVAANVAEAPNGTSSGVVTVSGDVPGGASQPVTVTLTKTAVVGPKIAVAPSGLALTTPVGSTTTGALTVTNPGDQPLNFTVTTTGGGATASGLWHQTTYRTLGGSPVWWYGDEVKKTYDTGASNSGALVYQGVSVPAGTPALTWQQWRQTESAGITWDKSLVQVSTNGTTWTTLLQVVDNDSVWKNATVSLAAYVGQTVSLRFFFDTVDSGANAYEGWYVGDVRVAGSLLGTSWLTASPASGTVAPGASATLTVQAAMAGLPAGSYAGQVMVASNATTGIVGVPITCLATTPAILTIGTPSFTDVGNLSPYVGDADGFAEPGETVRWNIPITNSGTQTATGVTVALSSASPWVTFPMTSITVGTVAGLSTATANLPIAIVAGCPTGTTIPVTATVTYGQGSVVGSGTFQVQVKNRISGTVRDLATGLPLSGVTVTSGGLSAITGTAGTYQINALSPGSYPVGFAKTGYVAVTATALLPPDATVNTSMGIRDLSVTPATLAVQLQRGQTTTQNLLVQGTGSLATTWSVSSKPTWLTLAPSGGTVAPGAAQNVAATIQTGTLGNGTYSGTLLLTTNASKGGTSRSIPTTLTIRSATPPTAGPLAITTAEDTAAVFALPAVDADGDSLIYTVVTQPAHGTLVVTASGQATYTPTTGWYGADTFTWKVSDGYDASSVATVAISVIPDQAPVAVPATVTLTEDGIATIVLSGTDPEGDALTVEILSGPLHGTSTATGGAWTGTYQPTQDWNGTDSVIYRVHDGILASAPVAITLVVTPVNDPPTWTPGAALTLDSDLGTILRSGWATDIRSGPDNEVGQTVTFQVTNDRPDLFVQQPAVDAQGRLSCQPVAGVMGIATLSIVAQDTGGVALGGIDVAAPVVRTMTLATYTDADLARESVATVGITASVLQVSETAGAATLTVTRTGDLAGDLLVVLQVGGTAIVDQDYTPVPTSVAMQPGVSSVTVPLAVLEDALPENPETLTVTLVAGAGYVADPAARLATVTIVDDEPVTVSIGVTDGTMAEPSDAGTYRITRSGPLTAPLSVNLAWEGTATAADVVARPLMVTIPVNSSSVSVTVVPIEDVVVEEVETLICRVVSGGPYAIGTATATINLQDNEPEEIAVEASTALAAEPGLPGTFRIVRRGSTAVARTLTYTLSGTAIPGTDFPAPSGLVSLAVGAGSATVTLTPSNDSVVESAETVILSLTPAAGVNLVRASATVTILDNDGSARPTVSLTTPDALANEGGATGSWTIARSGSTATDLVVRLQPPSGSATSGVDYQALPSVVTIPAGQSSVTVVLQPLEDARSEPNETVVLSLAADPTYLVSTSRSGTVTITDNESVTLSLALSDNKALEPGTDTGRFTISRTGPPTTALSVQVAVSGTAQAGVDYVALPGLVTIPVNAASASIVVTALDDALTEMDETVTLRILPGPGFTIVGATAATVTIGDDEAPVVEALVLDSQAVESGDKAVIRLNRLGSRTAALIVALGWSGTAINGTDVWALPTTATIAAGAGWTDITITPRQDTVVEPIETVILTVQSGVGYAVGSTPVASIALADDDAGTVTIAPVLIEADEWDPASRTVDVVRNGSCATAVSIAYTISGTARLAEPDGVRLLYLPAGVDRARLLISPHPDDRTEGVETVIITLQPGTGYSLGAVRAATINLHEAPSGGG